jgi:hypothetical protein
MKYRERSGGLFIFIYSEKRFQRFFFFIENSLLEIIEKKKKTLLLLMTTYKDMIHI